MVRSIYFNFHAWFAQLLLQSLFFFWETSRVSIDGIDSFSFLSRHFRKHFYLLKMDLFVLFRRDTKIIWLLRGNFQTLWVWISGICIRFGIVALLSCSCPFSWFFNCMVWMMYIDWIQLYTLFGLKGVFEMKLGNLSISVWLSLW